MGLITWMAVMMVSELHIPCEGRHDMVPAGMIYQFRFAEVEGAAY